MVLLILAFKNYLLPFPLPYLGVRMKVRVIVSLMLALLILISYFAAGENFTVNGSYSSVDTLGAYESWNAYKVTAGTDQKIEYSFNVQGVGSIIVLLVVGHSVTMSSDYLVLYSQETPTKSFSDTYPVSSSQGTRYSLVVMSEEYQNITYSVKIKVVDTPVTDYIIGGAICFSLIFGGVIIAAVLRYRKKKKRQSQQPYQYPQQPQYQPPPAQPPAQEVEWAEVEVVEPVRTQPPPPPPPPK